MAKPLALPNVKLPPTKSRSVDNEQRENRAVWGATLQRSQCICVGVVPTQSQSRQRTKNCHQKMTISFDVELFVQKAPARTAGAGAAGDGKGVEDVPPYCRAKIDERDGSHARRVGGVVCVAEEPPSSETPSVVTTGTPLSPFASVT